jgi:ABC-type uncharacterized transport system substrate-binding protein
MVTSRPSSAMLLITLALGLLVASQASGAQSAGRIAEVGWLSLAFPTAQHRLPAIYSSRGFVEAGGLMSYATHNAEVLRRAAAYVHKILKGAKPEELPVERPMTFELVINLKAANELGLTIPPPLLFQADEVIH